MAHVSIIYGWSEGPWMGKKLRAALHRGGFSVTKSLIETDIIIAHSGGCFILPSDSKANLIMLVGLPYWPDRSIFRSLIQKLRSEVKDLWWVKKTVFNTYYMASRPHRWPGMWRAWKMLNLPEHEDKAVIFVRNKNDHFLHPTEGIALAESRNWDVKIFDGHHDDLWINPEPYVKAIKEAL